MKKPNPSPFRSNMIRTSILMNNNNREKALTLVELIVAIAIVLVLAMILGGAVVRGMSESKAKAESVSKMRNIGQAITLFMNEHNRLPGPLWLTQDGRYYRGRGQLATFLRPYLAEHATPTRLPSGRHTLLPNFVTSHWERWDEQKRPSAPKPYRLTQRLYSTPAGMINPWGYVDDEGRDPRNLQINTLRFFDAINPSQTEALRDNFGGANAPEFGEIQNYVTRLYFDWRVEITDQ